MQASVDCLTRIGLIDVSSNPVVWYTEPLVNSFDFASIWKRHLEKMVCSGFKSKEVLAKFVKAPGIGFVLGCYRQKLM